MSGAARAAPGRGVPAALTSALTRRAWLATWPAAAALLGCTPVERPLGRGLDISGASYAVDFHLWDPQGRERSLADFRGKVVLLFFGFVQCADVCPAALFRNAELLRLLGDDGGRVQGLFVTLDPERDTPEIVNAYAQNFHPSFVGLRADLQRTQETAQHFKVFYRKVPTSGGYTLDHTSMTYVYDSAGKLRLGLPTTMTVREVADALAGLLPVSAPVSSPAAASAAPGG